MALAIGTQLGPYEVLSSIGAGGMGEVYKARDTRLDRKVAIKVLATHLSNHPEARERFEREARAISSLNHPHICTLHDIGEQDGIHYLVMEYLDGETLAARLERGPLTLADALKFAVQIANALDKAHREGVTHRDLKPGNIMLTKTGVKLLDFGLAKLRAVNPSGLQNSNLQTAGGLSAVTAEGTIIGTLYYMSPEQLEGTEADARSDIFSFGAVLYEMITGRKTFEGRSQPSVMAAILRADPPEISTLEPATPPLLDRVVKMCLAKDPANRWQTAHDLAAQLQWIAEGAQLTQLEAPVSSAAPSRSGRRLAWIITTIAIAASIALAISLVRALQHPEDTQAVRFEIQTAAMPNAYQISISPDGSTLAYVAARGDGKTALFLRPIDSLVAQPVAGTENALLPFWSPDSQYVAYNETGGEKKLKKVSIRGGTPQLIVAVDYKGGSNPGGTWNSDGVIVFGNPTDQPLRRVPAAGGIATPLAPLDKALEERGHGWPWFLPDGRHYLYLAQSTKPENDAIYVGSLDSTPPKRLMASDSMPLYAPPGFILFHRDGTLFAQRFDANRLTLSGEPLLIAENVAYNGNGRAAVAVSANGTLIYRSGQSAFPLTWVDRSSRVQRIATEPGQYSNPAISPDGMHVSFARLEKSMTNLWIIDAVRGTNARFTLGQHHDANAFWSPDGKKLAFQSDRGGVQNLYIEEVGTGVEQLLPGADHLTQLLDWSADGRYLIYEKQSAGDDQKQDLWAMPLTGDRKPFVFLRSFKSSGWAQLSPDSRWIAYESDEDGGTKIFVQSFPAAGTRYQVSTNSGRQPKWRGDGKEIFFLTLNGPTNQPSGAVMAVEITVTGDTVKPGVPQELFRATFARAARMYDVSRDGQRFIINGNPTSAESERATIPITVILNWPSLVNRK
jgi:serine/threonine protein kinase/Tol biopolymer transport system component